MRRIDYLNLELPLTQTRDETRAVIGSMFKSIVAGDDITGVFLKEHKGKYHIRISGYPNGVDRVFGEPLYIGTMESIVSIDKNTFYENFDFI
jgi:hypothetical protein